MLKLPSEICALACSTIVKESQEEEATMAKGDDIRERLVGFAVRVMDLCDDLAKTPAGTHVLGQLLRCATSAAPNYAEARGAESLSTSWGSS